MSTTAIISWGFVPGSLSTLVEYRVAGTTTWIVPNIPTNPTTSNSYPLIINNDVIYDVRLTTNGATCGPKSTTFQIVSSTGCCPSGFIISADGSYCSKIETTAATPPSGSVNSVAVHEDSYTICGSWIYSSYAINGTGTASQISVSNPFWVNGPGTCFVAGNFTDGPLNRTALWAPSPQPSQQIGFSYCVNIPSSKTYYIGIGADNRGIIKIDGVTILDQDGAAMDAQYGTPGSSAPFRVWAIYPVTILSGFHVIEILGENGPEPLPNPAAIGAEIYDNSAAEIAAATSYAQLNLLFSTKDHIGEAIQVGSGGVGYTCPSGYSLVLCDGPPYCRKVTTASPIPCNTTTTTTTSTTTTTTTT